MKTVQKIETRPYQASGLIRYDGPPENLEGWLGYVESELANVVEAGLLGWSPYTHIVRVEQPYEPAYYLVPPDAISQLGLSNGKREGDMRYDETYNGWTNHETWAVNLWLNDGSLDDLVEEVGEDETSLAEAIEELTYEVCGIDGQQPASLALDLLTSALEAVNWREIARAVIEG